MEDLDESLKKKLLDCQDCNINTFSLNGKEFICKIVNVYDADTCRAVFFLNGDLVKYTIRLLGVDSPEIRPPSKDKYRKYQIIEAKKSRNRLIQLSTDCNIEVNSEFTKNKIQKMINNNKKLVKIKCDDGGGMKGREIERWNQSLNYKNTDDYLKQFTNELINIIKENGGTAGQG